MSEWKQERPAWCPHTDCVFRRRVEDAICGGALPVPERHAGGMNTHRLCTRAPAGVDETTEASGLPVFDLQVNASDLEWFRWVFDALDGKATSWLSKRPGGAGGV